MRTEEEVNKIIEDMKKKTKGKYITQGCSFNKSCPRQMDLLKKALMTSISFSGLTKEMLALRFDGGLEENYTQSPSRTPSRVKDFGNFL